MEGKKDTLSTAPTTSRSATDEPQPNASKKGTFLFDTIQFNQFAENGFTVVRKAAWEATAVLGHGTYGTVFRVRNQNRRMKPQKAALKIFLNKESMISELKILRKLNAVASRIDVAAKHRLNTLFLALLIIEDQSTVCLNTSWCTYFGFVSDCIGKCSLFDAIYGKDKARWILNRQESKIAGSYLTPSMIIRFTRMILCALQFMHECCLIVHGDIKPSNVVLVEGPWGPIAKLTDFGLSQETQVFTQRFHCAKKRPTIQTLPYRSPEIIVWPSDSPLYGVEKSDIWSVGCVLYEMFQTKRLFREIKTEHTEATLFKEQICIAPTAPRYSSSDIQKDLGLRATRAFADLYRSIKFRHSEYQITSIPRAAEHKWLDSLWKHMLCFNPKKRLSARECINYIDYATKICVKPRAK